MTAAAKRPVLLTGGSGQVGSALRRLAPATWDIHAPGRSELDLGEPGQIADLVASRPWAAIINAGGYTAVDRAENDVVAAWRANALGPAALAHAAAKAGAPIVHISTDYVFDGRLERPYRETDATGPLNVYGASKLGGELAVRTAQARHVILRTAWVVSPTGSNFVKTMLRLGAERSVMRVVNDQRGCPTTAEDLAAAIRIVADRLMDDPAAPTGTYHYVGQGEATWFDLAEAVFAEASQGGARVPELQPIATEDYPTPAARPRNSVLDTAKITRDYGVAPSSWPAAVRKVVQQLAAPAAVGVP
jgi:dTDP-4-dehydrorhamnose reductase